MCLWRRAVGVTSPVGVLKAVKLQESQHVHGRCSSVRLACPCGYNTCVQGGCGVPYRPILIQAIDSRHADQGRPVLTVHGSHHSMEWRLRWMKACICCHCFSGLALLRGAGHQSLGCMLRACCAAASAECTGHAGGGCFSQAQAQGDGTFLTAPRPAGKHRLPHLRTYNPLASCCLFAASLVNAVYIVHGWAALACTSSAGAALLCSCRHHLFHVQAPKPF
jgi:hypothetical protein